ncbi:MAG: hypothetical protein PHR45_02725 [Muribaculaceae bacterium]|nr:hypothetical protein [Muribaculaceae bacterium]
MLDKIELLNEVYDKIPAYSKFLEKETGTKHLPADFKSLPLQTKTSYLLQYNLNELSRREDMDNFHLIGASSGFSKTGAIYWPKRPSDEAGYMDSLENMFVTNYHIDTKRTLVIECLAFGMWIGGMQIAAAMRNIALSGKYHFTLATPGLDFKATIKVIEDYKEIFQQILVITNPSNISLFTALLDEANIKLPAGTVSFPVVGEYFTEQFREHTALRYGHSIDSPYVVWTGYGSADTGDIGAETVATIAMRKYLYHNSDKCKAIFGTESAPMILALSSSVYLEVIDGSLVVTKDQFIPLIRYNTKDSGGILNKQDLKDVLPIHIYESLPETMVYVHGRVDNAVIFYGTNLMVNDISDYLLSLASSYHYAGLYTVHEASKNGITCFEFTIYVDDLFKADKKLLFDELIGFLRRQSAEFTLKYDNLSQASSTPLITVDIDDIKKIDTKLKHKFII